MVFHIYNNKKKKLNKQPILILHKTFFGMPLYVRTNRVKQDKSRVTKIDIFN